MQAMGLGEEIRFSLEEAKILIVSFSECSYCLTADFSYLLTYFVTEREREHKQGEGQRERKERIPSKLPPVSTEPNMGLNPMNHELMT